MQDLAKWNSKREDRSRLCPLCGGKGEPGFHDFACSMPKCVNHQAVQAHVTDASDYNPANRVTANPPNVTLVPGSYDWAHWQWLMYGYRTEWENEYHMWFADPVQGYQPDQHPGHEWVRTVPWRLAP